MKKEDIPTIKAVLLYILAHAGEDRRDIYSVVKTAYYAQQFHLVEYGGPMFNDTVAALPYGPVPSTMYDILKLAGGSRRELVFYDKGIQKEMLSAAGAIGFDYRSFYAGEAPDMGLLSLSAEECLDKAIAKVGGMSFYDIMHDTHGEEWRRAFDSPDKTMDPIGIARDGGANEAMLEYIADELEWEAICI